MATTRTATTTWHGSLTDGAGRVELDSSGLGGFDVTWASRANDPDGRTSPEELIGAAHSSCFSMALSSALAKAETPPETLETRADVTFQPGEAITASTSPFAAPCLASRPTTSLPPPNRPRPGCPVSQALTGTTITLTATLA